MDRPISRDWRPATYLGTAYSVDALERCGSPAQEDGNFENCIEQYWKDRIIKEFPEDFGYEPNYQNEYYNYLSLRVQKNVEEILDIDAKYPNWVPDRYDLSADELSGYSFKKSGPDEVRRQLRTISKINEDLERGNYPQRITAKKMTQLPTIFRNLRDFFDTNKRMHAKRDELWRDTLAASAILADVVTSCTTCRAVLVDIPSNEYQHITEFFGRIEGLRSLSTELRDIFSRFHVKLGPGTFVVFRHEGKLVYALFIDDEVKKYELTDYQKIPVDEYHLPGLFVQFLQSKGLVQNTAKSLYPVFGVMHLAEDDNWI